MEYGEYLAHRATNAAPGEQRPSKQSGNKRKKRDPSQSAKYDEGNRQRGRRRGPSQRADDFANAVGDALRGGLDKLKNYKDDSEKEKYLWKKNLKDRVDAAVERERNKKKNADAAKKKKRDRAAQRLLNLISGKTRRV